MDNHSLYIGCSWLPTALAERLLLLPSPRYPDLVRYKRWKVQKTAQGLRMLAWGQHARKCSSSVIFPSNWRTFPIGMDISVSLDCLRHEHVHGVYDSALPSLLVRSSWFVPSWSNISIVHSTIRIDTIFMDTLRQQEWRETRYLKFGSPGKPGITRTRFEFIKFYKKG
jgi:hypothetical protein